MPYERRSSLPGPSRPTPINTTINLPPSASPYSAPHSMTSFPTDDSEAILDVIPTRAGGKLCVRHKQMANQNINEKLQKVRAKLYCNLTVD